VRFSARCKSIVVETFSTTDVHTVSKASRRPVLIRIRSCGVRKRSIGSRKKIDLTIQNQYISTNSDNMSNFTYDQASGTFSLDGVHVCRGYYGTDTVVDNELTLEAQRDATFTVTVANNGTTVRVFSIPRDVYNEMTDRPDPWRTSADRVWFMSTFKNIDGHSRNWGTKNNTFGGMFESIVGEAGIQDVMQTTSGSLCISYFIRHQDNDLYGEMTGVRPHVIMTIGWNSSTGRYVHPHALPSQRCIDLPMMITPVDQTPNDSLFSATVPVQDGFPLLVTMYWKDGSVKSIKYITKHDESIRRFRCRTHSKFAALFATEQLRKTIPDSQDIDDELFFATELFTENELVQWSDTVKAARDELFNDLSRKLNGAYVEFPPKMYQHCNIKNVILSFGGNNSTENHQMLRDRVWANLCKCVDNRTICAVEEFVKVYCRISNV